MAGRDNYIKWGGEEGCISEFKASRLTRSIHLRIKRTIRNHKSGRSTANSLLPRLPANPPNLHGAQRVQSPLMGSLGLSKMQTRCCTQDAVPACPLLALPPASSMHLGNSLTWAAGFSYVKWWLWDPPQTVAVKNKWEHSQLSTCLAHREPSKTAAVYYLKKITVASGGGFGGGGGGGEGR